MSTKSGMPNVVEKQRMERSRRIAKVKKIINDLGDKKVTLANFLIEVMTYFTVSQRTALEYVKVADRKFKIIKREGSFQKKLF